MRRLYEGRTDGRTFAEIDISKYPILKKIFENFDFIRKPGQMAILRFDGGILKSTEGLIQ